MRTLDGVREAWAELVTSGANNEALSAFVATIQIEHILAVSEHLAEAKALSVRNSDALDRIANALERLAEQPFVRPNGILR